MDLFWFEKHVVVPCLRNIGTPSIMTNGQCPVTTFSSEMYIILLKKFEGKYKQFPTSLYLVNSEVMKFACEFFEKRPLKFETKPLKENTVQ